MRPTAHDDELRYEARANGWAEGYRDDTGGDDE